MRHPLWFVPTVAFLMATTGPAAAQTGGCGEALAASLTYEEMQSVSLAATDRRAFKYDAETPHFTFVVNLSLSQLHPDLDRVIVHCAVDGSSGGLGYNQLLLRPDTVNGIPQSVEIPVCVDGDPRGAVSWSCFFTLGSKDRTGNFHPKLEGEGWQISTRNFWNLLRNCHSCRFSMARFHSNTLHRPRSPLPRP